jgi:polysaccharide deacetylase family protein (PEP-CTERM system associated)
VTQAGTLHAMTVDVEDYFQVAALSRAFPPDTWESVPRRVVPNTQRLLELFQRKGVSATFFILGWVAEREPALVKEIAAAGHEIACHGYSHQLVYEQTPDVFRQETLRARDVLQDTLGQAVRGYRAASYSITRRSFWALDILAEAGFEWDSSIFPIRHDRYGVPSSPTRPYRLLTESGRELVEIPLTTADIFGQRLPAAGGGYFRLYPYAVSQALFSRAARDGAGIFYLHPWEVDPEQPRVTGVSALSRFRHYNNLDRCMSRLESLLNDFQFGTVSAAVLGATVLPSMNQSEL